MISMKNDPASEDAAEAGATTMMSDPPLYPYGLQIRLEEDQIAALGIKTLPAVGTKVRIVALAEVSAVSQMQEQGGEVCQCLTLQITDMDPPKPASAMYPNSDMNP